MNGLIAKPFEKRFILAALILVVLAFNFWTGSRYPSLDEKAVMSGAIQLEDSLSFEAKYPISPDMVFVERVFWSTLNWIFTNQKGMTFGVLFAAAFLTALGYVRTKSFRGGYSNSVLGLFIGTPLGVCVNCAAPIARGMYSGGLRAETTLSAMIASPTLNVVVLTMLFSLLPFYMAVTKIALSLLVILVVVPLICKTLARTEVMPELAAPAPWTALELGLSDASGTETMFAAVWGVAWAYTRNLWYIIKTTVPLMVLAGFLGTLAATLLPQEDIIGLGYSVVVLICIAAVGVFLPVPIGFDVVVTGALLTSGLEQGYVMALLFTLGSFSIYSFFIVAQSVGQKAAWLLAGAFLSLGVVAGVGVQNYHDWQTERALRMLTGEYQSSDPMWSAAATELPPWQVTSPDKARIHFAARPFSPNIPADAPPFTRLEAVTIGVDAPLEFSFADMWPPFWEGRSLASGDIDNDGDLDLVIASTEVGLYLYANDGTGQFSRMAMDDTAIARLPVFNAVLADVDNDGWRDLILATYRDGNFLWRNANGTFTGMPIPIANRPDAVLSLALTLADADRDGDLDLALGNWAAGWYRRIPGEESRNRIVWNDRTGLTGDTFTDLPGIPGETLTLLFSDIDGNGTADLLEGNDFDIPDYIYLADGNGSFTAVTHADALIPHTTTTTMAIKTADLMNDGSVDLYFAQIAGRSSGISKKLKMQPIEAYCDTITTSETKSRCLTNMEIKSWYKSGNNFDPTYASRCQELTGRYQAECKAMLVKDLAIQKQDPSICKLIPASQPRPRSFCDIHFQPPRPITADEAEASVSQILRSNVLLEREGTTYVDTATTRGLEVGGWSWDTKIADFDNDGWQDVYIVNGTWVPNEVTPSNMFYHNDGAGKFTEASGPFGLEDYLMTAAATAFDMDGDGDLDMITYPVNGPVIVFRNNSNDGNAITLQLEDHAGNRDGIGATLWLTDDQGGVQMREVQLGGGFMSFDAPWVHFGLGDDRKPTHLRIRWADGSETEIAGPLDAGQHYMLRRDP